MLLNFEVRSLDWPRCAVAALAFAVSGGMASTQFMLGLGLQMCVPAEHLPVFVVGREGDLFTRKSGFEEAACALVPEVIEVKFDDVESAALASESRTHRSSVVGKNS
jgi:hypothetical protein